MKVVNEAILAKLNKELKRLKLARSRVAEKIGVDQSYFQKMCTGQRPLRLDVLGRVAGAIGVPVWELLKGDHDPPSHHLGPLEIPLIKPQTLLRFRQEAGGLSMEHVDDVISVPRVPGLNLDKERRVVAILKTQARKGHPAVILIVDPVDVTYREDCQFLISLGDALNPEFIVARLVGGEKNVIAYGQVGPPTPIELENILGRVVWELKYYPS